MRLILRYPNGMRAEALLLAREDDLLRIIMRGFEETLELRLHEGEWHDEQGQRVSIEAMLCSPPQAAQVMTAGGAASR
jgi:hypothetical protein